MATQPILPAKAPLKNSPDEFKAMILSAHPDGVAYDGRKYADIPAYELTTKVVQKFPDAKTNDGRNYAVFLKPQHGKERIAQLQQETADATAAADEAAKPSTIFKAAVNPIVKRVNAVGQPLINLAAMPVQAGAKALGLEDPFAGDGANSFQDQTGANVTPIDKPLTKVGSAAQVGSMFFPVAKTTAGITGVAGKVVGPKIASAVGNIAAGGLAGYNYDVASNLAEGKSIADSAKPGMATLIGAGIPAVAPALSAVGRLASESTGVTTGVGRDAVAEMFRASAKGGDAAKAARDALFKTVSPEQLVQTARDAFDIVKTNRSTAYKTALEGLKQSTQVLDDTPVLSAFDSKLKDFNIKVNKGKLDFSQSAIDLDAEAKNTISDIYDKLNRFGTQEGDKSVIGMDALKRSFSSLYSESSSARAFAKSMEKSVSNVLNQVPGYEKMAKAYEQSSDMISNIQKSLSLGDQAGIDAAFRKISTSLRINNEERAALVKELDDVSGGKLLPMVAGQQLNQLFPRGLMRQLGGAGALGSALTGGGLGQFIALIPFASPKVVGSLVYGLGLGSRATNYLLKALAPGLESQVLPKAGKLLSE